MGGLATRRNYEQLLLLVEVPKEELSNQTALLHTEFNLVNSTHALPTLASSTSTNVAGLTAFVSQSRSRVLLPDTQTASL